MRPCGHACMQLTSIFILPVGTPPIVTSVHVQVQIKSNLCRDVNGARTEEHHRICRILRSKVPLGLGHLSDRLPYSVCVFSPNTSFLHQRHRRKSNDGAGAEPRPAAGWRCADWATGAFGLLAISTSAGGICVFMSAPIDAMVATCSCRAARYQTCLASIATGRPGSQTSSCQRMGRGESVTGDSPRTVPHASAPSHAARLPHAALSVRRGTPTRPPRLRTVCATPARPRSPSCPTSPRASTDARS